MPDWVAIKDALMFSVVVGAMAIMLVRIVCTMLKGCHCPSWMHVVYRSDCEDD